MADREYIGGYGDTPAIKYLKKDKKLNDYIHTLAYKYDLPIDTFYQRLLKEGVLNFRVRRINAGKEPSNVSLLDLPYDSVNLQREYGLDYIWANLEDGRVVPQRQVPIEYYGWKPKGYTERPSGKVKNHADALELYAAQLAMFKGEAEKYLGSKASKQDISNMTRLMYNQGVAGGKKRYETYGRDAYNESRIRMSKELDNFLRQDAKNYPISIPQSEVKDNKYYTPELISVERPVTYYEDYTLRKSELDKQLHNPSNNSQNTGTPTLVISADSTNPVIQGINYRNVPIVVNPSRQVFQYGLGGNSTYGTRITSSDISNQEVGAGQTITGSTLQGVASGAGTGAMIGSIIPGIGTVAGLGIGALLGLFTGLFGGFKKTKQAKEQLAEQEEQQRIATINNMDTKLENDVYLTRQSTDQTQTFKNGFQMRFGGRYIPRLAYGGDIKINLPGKNYNGWVGHNQRHMKKYANSIDTSGMTEEEKARVSLYTGDYTAMAAGMVDYMQRHGEVKNITEGDWQEWLPKYREMVANVNNKIESDINMFRSTDEGDDNQTLAVNYEYQMPYGGVVPNSANTSVAYGPTHEQIDPTTGETGVPYEDVEIEGGGIKNGQSLPGEVVKHANDQDIVYSDRLTVPGTNITYADFAKILSDKKGQLEKQVEVKSTALNKLLADIPKFRTTIAKQNSNNRNVEKAMFSINRDTTMIKELDSKLNELYNTQEQHAEQLGIRNAEPIMASGGKVDKSYKLQDNSEKYIALDTYYPLSSRYPFTGHSAISLVEDQTSPYLIDKLPTDKGYNVITNNCSDATKKALERTFNKNLKTALFTTPGDVRDFALEELNGIPEFKEDSVFSPIHGKYMFDDGSVYREKGRETIFIPVTKDQKDFISLYGAIGRVNKEFKYGGKMNTNKIFACGGRRLKACGGRVKKADGGLLGLTLGTQFLAGLGNYFNNQAEAKRYENIPVPLQTKEIAPIYNWRYNIGDQLEEVDRQTRTANNYITRNVSNAQVARNLVSQNTIQSGRIKGQLYGEKNRYESQGRNMNIQARYQNDMANAQKMYQNAVDKYNQQVAASGMRAQANRTLMTDMLGVVQTGLTAYQQEQDRKLLQKLAFSKSDAKRLDDEAFNGWDWLGFTTPEGRARRAAMRKYRLANPNMTRRQAKLKYNSSLTTTPTQSTTSISSIPYSMNRTNLLNRLGFLRDISDISMYDYVQTPNLSLLYR